MLSTERAAFEAQLTVLCAGFDEPMNPVRTEAYWRGLHQMPLLIFERLVEYALGPDGPADLPTTRQVWAMNRAMRSTQAARSTKRPTAVDPFESFANVRLLEFLITHPPGASEESLVEMILKKNDLVLGYQREASMDPRYAILPRLVFMELKADMAEVLANSFSLRFVPLTKEYLVQAEDVVARTGHGVNFSDAALARLTQKLL